MVTEKVYAYITHEDRLLVFRHTHHPEAGIQVPGGTVEGQESPQDAVLREAMEETGLENLEIISYLGMHPLDLATFGETGIHNRHFYQLFFLGDRKDKWRHFEKSPSVGHPGPIEFEFYWVKFPEDVPELAGDQGVMLHKVRV